ncbi:MAG: hypothetical protein WAU70_15920 [Flavobacteriales bacterium]
MTTMRAMLMTLSLGCMSSALPQGALFPELKGETPLGKHIDLPRDAKGKFTILCLAYDKSANDQLTAWFEPAYLRFVMNHGLFASHHDVNIWFVPMFTGMNKAAYAPVMKKVQKSEAPEVQDHILFFQGDMDLYVRELDMGDKTKPYIFLLNDTGEVIHRESGEFTDDKLEAIEEALPQ